MFEEQKYLIINKKKSPEGQNSYAKGKIQLIQQVIYKLVKFFQSFCVY